MTAEKLRIYGIWISVESGRIMKVLKAWGRPVAEMYGNGLSILLCIVGPGLVHLQERFLDA